MLQVTPEEFVERNLAMPGHIILSNRPGTWLARAINGAQAAASGQVEVWQHAMRMGRDGLVISQESTKQALPLSHWKGARLKIWRNGAYTEKMLNSLVDMDEARLGTKYDYPGTFFQLLTVIPWVGDWLAARADVPWRNFCSEGVCEVERRVSPQFGGSGACQISPARIDAWCAAHPPLWKSFMVELV